MKERRFVANGHVYVERDGHLVCLGKAATFENLGISRPPLKLPAISPSQLAALARKGTIRDRRNR